MELVLCVGSVRCDKATGITRGRQVSREATKALKERDSQLEASQKEVEDLKERKGSGGRKTTKHLQADDVNIEIERYVKDILFRNVKFTQPGTDCLLYNSPSPRD